MAVVTVWKCDRDGSMFEDKKAADEHDKMLELADSIAQLIEAELSTVSAEDAENIGLLLARRKEDLVKACKGKPALLLPEEEKAKESAEASEESAENSNLSVVNG